MARFLGLGPGGDSMLAPTEIAAFGVSFPTAGDYAVGVNGQFANAYRRIRFVGSLDAQAAAGFKVIAGLDSGSGGSISLCSEDRSGAVYAMAQVMAFDGVYSTRAVLHVMTPIELGRYVVHDVWTDGTYICHALNGRLINVRIADIDVSWTSPFGFTINTRPGTPGTLAFGALTVFDVQLSTSVPDGATFDDRLATVRADVLKLPGTLVGGTLNHWWGGAGLTSTTWTDQVSGRVLTFTGSPVQNVRKVVYQKAAGQLVFEGDSNMIRDTGGTVTGNGPRKYVLTDVLNAGYAASADGKFSTSGTSATKDYDGRNIGVGGQAIGVANGAVASALSTLASDLSTYVSPDGSIVINFGANDGYVYCNTPGGNSGAAGAALFFAQYDTLIATVGAYMNPGRPIVVTTPRRPATGVSTAAQRDFFVEVYAGWLAKIATWQATWPGVESADSYALITATQADANDVARQPDGTHLSDLWIPVEAGAQSAALLRALARAPA